MEELKRDTTEILNTDIENLQPTWLITAACLALVALFTWGIGSWFYSISPKATPFLMAIPAIPIFGCLYVLNRNENQRKAVKSCFDVSWNIWTAISVAYLFNAAASVASNSALSEAAVATDLVNALRSQPPVFLTFIFAWAYSTAVGCIVIAACDHLWPASKSAGTPPETK